MSWLNVQERKWYRTSYPLVEIASPLHGLTEDPKPDSKRSGPDEDSSTPTDLDGRAFVGLLLLQSCSLQNAAITRTLIVVAWILNCFTDSSAGSIASQAWVWDTIRLVVF